MSDLNNNLIIVMFVFIGLLVLFMILNILSSRKNGKPSNTFSRLMHLSGIAAVVINIVRCYYKYSDNRVVMILANVIVLVSLLISLLRVGRTTGNENEDNN